VADVVHYHHRRVVVGGDVLFAPAELAVRRARTMLSVDRVDDAIAPQSMQLMLV
jgi:hypothetical protein